MWVPTSPGKKLKSRYSGIVFIITIISCERVMDWRTHTFVVINFLIVALLVYVLLHYRFDGNTERSADEMAMRLYENDGTRALVNGSGVNNIPNLRIVSTNAEVVRANGCGSGPVYIGVTGEDSDCVRTCVNDTAKAVHVGDGETLTYQSTVLKPGVHCLLGARPECNMKTTVAMMTVNSITCRTKFPRLFGGKTGGDIVACNNSMINNPQNVLWDYAENRRVDPWRSVVTDEDERLSDGSYRYRCKYSGLNERENPYIPHPYDRFHPITNYCADLVYRAHPDVRTVFSDDRNSYTCRCGDPSVTRVRNLVPDDPASQCSDVVYDVVRDVKERKRITVPYRCVTVHSPLAEVGRYPVCPEDKFLKQGSAMAAVQLEFTSDENQLIEHPLYRDFGDTAPGVCTPDQRGIYMPRI